MLRLTLGLDRERLGQIDNPFKPKNIVPSMEMNSKVSFPSIAIAQKRKEKNYGKLCIRSRSRN